ncbi:MAG TPA: CoA ester lyase [Acidimicrobiales bacterium]|nr:CoA ester lyase [Acidimicrobiales bacterium]
MHVVPASNERFLSKAASLAPDAFLLDLEDGVAPADKAAARRAAVEVLQGRTLEHATCLVRVNASDSSWFADDLDALVSGAGSRLDGVALPKAGSAAQVAELDHRLSALEQREGITPQQIGLAVIIEHAEGFVHLDEILSASRRVDTVLFGPLDFAASLAMPGADGLTALDPAQEAAFLMVRARVLIAARAVGACAVDGPFFRPADETGLLQEARSAASLGYDGKLTIHPSQIAPVNETFTPTAAELARALAITRLFDGSAPGALRHEGAMVDEATRKLAERTVRRARAAGLG